ncbi:MAG: hypothetical protein L6266_02015 [Nanoarchaeota archaeon]|nr:hypothetical protein [Nanoarchaeota archaeon]
MPELDFFDNVQNLEKKCPKCEVVIDYGVTTKYDQREGGHVCLECGCVLK